MKLVIIGGTGLIGSKLVAKLREHAHEAVPASPDTGVNTLTGQGLAEVLQGASVVVDVSNSPSFEAAAVMEFFTTSTRNLLTYAAAAGVKHMLHTGCCRVREKVARGCGEELHDRRGFERRGVRHVDDDRRALEDLREPLTGECVDARVRRCRHGLMGMFSQFGHEL